MARDQLAIVIRLRRTALDEARHYLAECVAAEDRALAVLRGTEEELERQRRAAEQLTDDDTAVEAFAAWLARYKPVAAQAEADHEKSMAETARARAALAAARAAVEVAEELHERRAEEARAAALRAEQQEMDEIGRSRRASGPG